MELEHERVLTVEDIETAGEDELIFLGQPFASNDINFSTSKFVESCDEGGGLCGVG